MDYQYIKSIVGEIYRDLPGKFSFPPECMEELNQYCLNDRFIRNEIADVLTYFSTTASGTPVLVLSRTAEKKAAKSVGYFSQCLGWAWRKELLSELGDEVFTSAFYEERELDELSTKGDIPKQREHIKLDQIEIAPKAIKAVLYAVMHLWLAGGDAVKIAVPKEDDYNNYVLAAVRQIYSYFPMALRLRAGFCSRLSEGQKAGKKIFICFVPAAIADEETIFLDASNEKACNKYIDNGTEIESLNKFIEHLMSLEEESRKIFLRDIYEEVEGAGDPKSIIAASAQNYHAIGKALAYMDSEQKLEALIPSWIRFFSRQDKFPKCLRGSLFEHIKRNLPEEAIKSYTADKFASTADIQGLMAAAMEFEPVFEALPELADGGRRSLSQRLDSFNLSKTEKLAVLEKYISVMPHIIYTRDLTVLKVSIKKDEFEQLQNMPKETTTQIEFLINKLRPLYNAVVQIGEDAIVQNLAYEIKEELNWLESKKASADALLAQAREKMNAQKGYFSKLEALVETIGDSNAINEDQKAELERELHNCCPCTFGDYGKAYHEAYGQRLTLQSLANRNALVASQILVDIGSFEELVVHFRRGRSAVELSEAISKTSAVSNLISETCRVKVAEEPTEQAEKLRELLMLSPNYRSGLNKKEQNAKVLRYVGNGIFRGRDIPTVCQFLADERDGKISADDAIDVLKNIAQGNFKNSSAAEYWLAYEYLYKNMQDKSPLDRISGAKDKHGAWNDAEAKKVLEGYVKSRTPKGNKLKTANVFLSVITGILLVGTIAVGILWSKDNSKLKAETERLEELQQATVDSYEIALFRHDFEKYRCIFENAVNNPASYAVLNAYYQQHEPEELISVGNVKTVWKEAFFWNCVHAAEGNENITEKALEDAISKAKSAILLISGLNPVPTEPKMQMLDEPLPIEVEDGSVEMNLETAAETGETSSQEGSDTQTAEESQELLAAEGSDGTADEQTAEDASSAAKESENIAEGCTNENLPDEKDAVHDLITEVESIVEAARTSYDFAQTAINGGIN